MAPMMTHPKLGTTPQRWTAVAKTGPSAIAVANRGIRKRTPNERAPMVHTRATPMNGHQSQVVEGEGQPGTPTETIDMIRAYDQGGFRRVLRALSDKVRC
jgi:hypothetical protein